MSDQVLHYSAFTTDPAGGNPAGVVLDARGLPEAEMQAIATRLGYSESVFLLPRTDGGFDVRYFSPKAEVPFCGHATIAAAVAHADRHGPGERVLHTRSGIVRVTVDAQGLATLVSLPPRVVPLAVGDLDAILAALRWSRADLDAGFEPALAYAGAWHPVLLVAGRARLAALDYDFEALAALMAAKDWTTIALAWREDAGTLHVRNPFPPGGIVEDPATGAAAAALGAYLAANGALPRSRAFLIRQGEDMVRPSRLEVHVPEDPTAGVRVSGAAVALPGPGEAPLRA